MFSYYDVKSMSLICQDTRLIFDQDTWIVNSLSISVLGLMYYDTLKRYATNHTSVIGSYVINILELSRHTLHG